MAYVHVAIPLNITTFKDQSDILGDYLFKLSRVVDSNFTDREKFLESIREIARFGQVKLQRLINRVDYLDNILPYDGDITSKELRNKRMTRRTNYDGEIIDYNQYLTNDVQHPIELNDFITNQESLILEHDWELKQKLALLREEA